MTFTALLMKHDALFAPEVGITPNLRSFIDRWDGGSVEFFVEESNFDLNDRHSYWVVSYKRHHDKK